MNILVTGATGYIAGRLIPQLLARGYRVRALARDPQRLTARSWYNQVELFTGDVLDPRTLQPALQDIHTAYYLIHNMSSGHGYTKIEIQAAQNFAQLSAQAGVQHIIYLGGLADPEQHIAPHMRSRIETGITLRAGSVPVTEFRAGVIAGSGSISFEMIRFMAELLPLIPGPLWLRNKAQPIAAQNVIDYLLAALENSNGQGGVFEAGGPQVLTYRALMETYARARGLARRVILLPYLPIELMARGVELTTPVPRRIARALIGGLSRDSVVLNRDAREVYPINLVDFETAARAALSTLHPLNIEPVWTGELRRLNPFKHEGFFIDQRVTPLPLSPDAALEKLSQFAPTGFTRESATATSVLLRGGQTALGARWLQYQVTSTALMQTHYFAPRGMLGFLLGYGLYFSSARLLSRCLRFLRAR